MKVFLLPVGADHYELYCEEADEQETAGTDPPAGFVRGMKHRFSQMLAQAERERRLAHSHAPQAAGRGWGARVKARTMRWIAEAIAEQRLLWHLRGQTAASLVHPDDLASPAALAVLRRQLTRDSDKHRFWLIVDSVGFVVSGLLFLVPGPNIIAYYFGFRLVGHLLSVRGARQGLDRVAWSADGSAALRRLREALALSGEAREARVQDVATELGLEHLPRFFARTALPGATS